MPAKHNTNLNYQWSIADRPDGSTSKLSNDDQVKVSFRPDKPGSYQLQLIVDNNIRVSEPATFDFVADCNAPGLKVSFSPDTTVTAVASASGVAYPQLKLTASGVNT